MRSPGAPSRDRITGRTPWNELRGTKVLEAIMAGVEAAAAIALFLAAMAITVLAVVAYQVRREDHQYSLAEEAHSIMSRGTRRLTGFGRRGLYLQVHSAGRRAAA